MAIRDAEQHYLREADPLEARLSELREELKKIYQPEYEKLQQRMGRWDVRIYTSHATHLALLALLTIGELAFNLVVFNVFQEPAVYTALMALAIGVAIPLCAWAVGVWVRQWPPPWWVTAAKIVVVTAVVMAVLAGINQIRLGYLAEQDPKFTAAHPELTVAFFTVNIVILVAAAVSTYLAYDPEPGFAEAKSNVDRCNARIRTVAGRLDQLANAVRTEVEMAKEAGWQLMAYYRMVNRRGREQVPAYYDDDNDKNHRPAFVEVITTQIHGGVQQPSDPGVSSRTAAADSEHKASGS
jgi:hypothetical protein